jgi:uncharacterized membrane protein
MSANKSNLKVLEMIIHWLFKKINLFKIMNYLFPTKQTKSNQFLKIAIIGKIARTVLKSKVLD